MSAPAMKALSPAPVRITPRTEASALASSNAARKSIQVGVLSALSTFGRLTVTQAIEPFFSYWTFASTNAALGTELGTVAGDGVNDAVPETIVISPRLGGQPASERR